MFMLRTERWKYNVYPGYASELYDMQSDPGELNDLSRSSDYSDVREQCNQKMLELVDPGWINELAFADQAALIEKLGGVDAILNSDEFDYTPVGS